MTKTKFILRCAFLILGWAIVYALVFYISQGCKTTKPVRYSPIQNDRYYAINQTTMPLYVIRYDTWTVEETDVHDIRDPKFNSELEAEQVLLVELYLFYGHTHESNNRSALQKILKGIDKCHKRIQKLKQQSI